MFLILFNSLLETLGIGLVGPFMGLASDSKLIYQNHWLNWAYVLSGLNSASNFIFSLGLIIILVFCIKSALTFLIQRHIYRFTYAQQADLRSRLLHAYLAVPYTFHLTRNTAVLIQNVSAEITRFSNGILLQILNSATNISMALFLMVLLIETAKLATLTILTILIFAFFAYNQRQFKNKIGYWGKVVSISSMEIIRIMNHSLGGIKETRIIGCQPYFENQMDEQSLRLTRAMSWLQVFRIVPRISIELLLIIFLVGFTCLFTISNQGTQNLTSVLGIFAIASIRMMPKVTQLMSSLTSLRSSKYALDKIYFDLKELEKLKIGKEQELSQHSSPNISLRSSQLNGQNGSQAMPFVNQIVLDKVTYYYPNASEASLKDISLTIKKGQSIGLIGKSGAGKTTLVDVILGLLLPDSGGITVNGKSIYDNLRSWQNLIGYIPQSIFLIDDTIERNIAFGVPDHLIDPDRLDKAIKAAQLAELVEELPDGVKTFIGERGVRLSGGQRQRIGIARVLYHQREILVLDEATSALDSETESLVSEAIKFLSGTKTLIIIAHRLSTIEHCDCIYLIDKGRLVKSGSYQEVILGK